MSVLTNFLKLIKPDKSEKSSIDVINANSDLLDSAIKELSEKITSCQEKQDVIKNEKVDKVNGKGLSENDLTNTLKSNYDKAYSHSTSVHAPSNAEENKIGEIKINGEKITPIDKVVDISGLSKDGHKHTKSDISDFPESMPASDVSAWAKEKAKPTYTASEVGLGNVGNFKAVSTVASQGLTDIEKSNARANIGAQVAGSYASSTHNHDDKYQAKGSYASASHTHDDRYYTETEVDTKLGTKVDLSADGVSKAINQLSTATATPSDADYYISQYASGGTTTTSYHRRTMSALWSYIKSKADSVYAKVSHTHIKSQITDFPSSLPANGGNSSTVNGHTVNSNVPSGAKFTDTTYSSKAAASGGTDVSLVTTGEKAIWNAKTSNTGTITGIKMNGVSKGTSGVVDLGTVLTGGKQSTTSTADGGENVYTFSDGSTITVKNGSKGNTGATPTIKAAAGTNIGAVGTPSVTAGTSGTTTTFTFNNLKGAKGDKGDNATTTAVATTSANGLMSKDMVTKLNGISSGANKYTHPTTSGNKHIPSGGKSGQVLRWSSDGTAVWGNETVSGITYSTAKPTTVTAGMTWIS